MSASHDDVVREPIRQLRLAGRLVSVTCALAVFLASAGGCFNPELADRVRCANSNTCPDGLSCHPDGFCRSGTAPDGGTVINDAASVDGQQQSPNIVFITSTTFQGDFGAAAGIAAADGHCVAHAEAAGIGGTYVAWISGPEIAAKDKIANASGWIRPDGKPFANTVDDILAGRIFYPVDADEAGMRVNGTLWTATGLDGTYDENGDCEGWTTAMLGNNVTVGSPRGGFGRFTANGQTGCIVGSRFLCFGVDNQATVAAPNEIGRIAFVTEGAIAGTAGLAAFENRCTVEAAAANLPGTFTVGVSLAGLAISDRVNQGGALPWVRPDGVKLFETPASIGLDDSLLAPIQMTASGVPKNSEVWTGAGDFNGTNPNCLDFTTNDEIGIIGVSAISGVNGASFNSAPCSQTRPVYCFQD